VKQTLFKELHFHDHVAIEIYLGEWTRLCGLQWGVCL